jgi:hypothetical protein
MFAADNDHSTANGRQYSLKIVLVNGDERPSIF